MRKVKVAVCGYGNRGGIYAQGQEWFPQQMEVVAVADAIPKRREKAKRIHCLQDSMLFDSAESLFALPRMADVAFIATQDQFHYNHAIAALEQGYHLLLEKPIGITEAECRGIYEKAKSVNRTVLVCHVLRYSPFYTTIKNIIQTGALGEIISIDQIENVGYFHIAHSYVRGSWRNTQIAAPMILAKSCHDMDVIAWLLGKKPRRLSSFGSLRHFKPEFAPAGSSHRCLDCAVRHGCPYDAVHLYLEGDPLRSFRTGGNTGWPVKVITDNPTDENVVEALREGPYGRCVYQCDNNVVDHQVVNLEYDEGTTATFSMVGFTAESDRTIQIMGTKGQLNGAMEHNTITLSVFKEEPVEIKVDVSDVKGGGHAGSDYRTVKSVLAHYIDYPVGEDGFLTTSDKELPEIDPPVCTIEHTMFSHMACFAAEYSRLHGGQAVELTED